MNIFFFFRRPLSSCIKHCWRFGRFGLCQCQLYRCKWTFIFIINVTFVIWINCLSVFRWNLILIFFDYRDTIEKRNSLQHKVRTLRNFFSHYFFNFFIFLFLVLLFIIYLTIYFVGPVVAAFNDFWRMIWEQDTDKIIMVTNLVEKSRVSVGSIFQYQLLF